jgi:hypothetical protein
MNIEYDNELNNRLYSRISPSQTLPPLFEVRPVSTKYTFFQTIEERAPVNTPMLKYNYITPENTFIPGSRAPIDYFMDNVDIESKLRNQFMSLQKSSQSVYVPELNSSLYENPQVYKKQEYANTTCKTTTINKNLAPDTFYNFTRNNFRK